MLGILCGMEMEAKIAGLVKGARVACAAVRPEKARRAADELVALGATRLLSFGLAGGLVPQLSVGTIVIGTSVRTERENWICDSGFNAILGRRMPLAQSGTVWGSETLVAQAREKRAINARTQCVIVDMESQCVAEVAAARQVPFSVLRIVADTVDMDMPPATLVPFRGDGSVDMGGVIRNLFCHPGQIPALLHLGNKTGKALKTLRGTAEILSAL
ncbi:MAG: hypothetical protein HGA90_02430 [Alphaproteobacteria bacterium]|nr:hypothetical protein [Alphaproteobacteria bacterium]